MQPECECGHPAKDHADNPEGPGCLVMQNDESSLYCQCMKNAPQIAPPKPKGGILFPVIE